MISPYPSVEAVTIATFPDNRFAEEELILIVCPTCKGSRDIRRNIILVYDIWNRKYKHIRVSSGYDLNQDEFALETCSHPSGYTPISTTGARHDLIVLYNIDHLNTILQYWGGQY